MQQCCKYDYINQNTFLTTTYWVSVSLTFHLVKLILPTPYMDTSTLRLCLLLPYHKPAQGVTDVAAC